MKRSRRGSIIKEKIDKEEAARMREERERFWEERSKAIRERDARRAERGLDRSGGARALLNEYRPFMAWLKKHDPMLVAGNRRDRFHHPYGIYLSRIGITVIAVGQKQLIIMHGNSRKPQRISMADWLIRFTELLDREADSNWSEPITFGQVVSTMNRII